MIELRKVTTGYSRDKPIQKDFSYSFENNMIYGILGESGCGKTTLLKTIAGLMQPLSGEVYVDNVKLRKAGENDIYMMHQNYTSFDWLTCLDNILITRKVKHLHIGPNENGDAVRMLKAVGLKGHILDYPTQLSGGQRQRLALARTLYIEPQIILMDEPLSALDEETRADMQELILDIHKKTKNTIIMVTHSKKEAEKMCDKILKF